MNHPAAHAEQLAICIDGNLHIPVLVAFHVRCEEVFAPVLDPFDGTAQFLRDQRDQGFFDVVNRLRAEPAAHIGRDHAHLVGFPAQHVDDILLHQERRLRRRPDGQHVLQFVVLGDHTAVLDGKPAAPVDPVFLAMGHMRVGERSRDIAIADGIFGPFVIGRRRVTQRRIALERGFAIGRPRQDIEIDLHQRRRVLGVVAGIRDNKRDRLAGKTDLAVFEQSLLERLRNRGVRHLERHRHIAQVFGQIGGGINRNDTGPGFRRGGIDASDLGVAVGRADERRLQHARQVEIVGIAAAPGQQAWIFQPRDPRAEHFSTHETTLRLFPAPAVAWPHPGRRQRFPDIRCTGTDCH